MEEERKSTRTFWLILGIILGVTVLCSVSALAGGVAGYMIGRRTAQQVTVREAPSVRIMPRLVPEMPAPQREVPQMPELPEILSGGALIVFVEADSPASGAGLREGDIITAVDGESLDGGDLAAILSEYNPGDEVEFTVFRNGREQMIQVELGPHPQRGNSVAYLGVRYRSMPGMQFRFEGPGQGLRVPFKNPS